MSSEAQDSSNPSGPAHDRLTAYLAWATNAVLMLEHRISAADIDRLVLTRGYKRLLSVAGSLTGLDVGTQRLLNGLLSLEIQQRITALDQAAKDLDTQIQLWSGFAEFTIPDISVYSEHDDKLEDLDFPAAICAPRRQPVRVIVPMIILDELDGLKNRTPSPHGKWRAAYTLGVMDKAFTNTALPGLFLAPVAANPVSGGVFLDVVFDPPGHVRLPIADDEIIDRALAVQALAGRNVPLLTFDTSQSSPTRHAGLLFIQAD